MAQGRSVWREVFINIINSIKPRNLKGELRGKDYLGNEYYEASANSHRRRERRWFIPPNVSDTENEIENEIPVEWEAWLRHKRKVPPTEEEIQLNMVKMKNMIQNAKKLEQQRNKTDKISESKSSQSSFPIYEEYSTGPSTEQDQKNSA